MKLSLGSLGLAVVWVAAAGLLVAQNTPVDDGVSRPAGRSSLASVQRGDPLICAPQIEWFDETNGGAGFVDFASLAATHSAWVGPTDGAIDFEGLPLGVKIADQYADLGVSFTGADGGNFNQLTGVRAEGADPIEDLTGYDGTYQPDGSQIYIRFQNTTENPDAPLAIHFDQPQQVVAGFLATGVQGQDHSFTIEAKDAGGISIAQNVVLSELWETDPTGQNYETLFAVRSDLPIIRSISITNNSTVEFSDALIIDTIQWAGTPPPAIGDQDGDGDSDLTDFDFCRSCMSGPNVAAEPGCESCDLNDDSYVDLQDHAITQQHFTGCTAGCLSELSCFESSGQVVMNVDPGDENCMFSAPVSLSSFGTQSGVIVHEPPPHASGDPIQTELVQMELVGFDPTLQDVTVRVRSDVASRGQIDNVVADAGGNLVSGDSSFDVFFEIEIPSIGLVLDTGTCPMTLEAPGVNSIPPIGAMYVPAAAGSIPLYIAGTTTHAGWLCSLSDDPLAQADCDSVLPTKCIYKLNCAQGACTQCSPPPPPACWRSACTPNHSTTCSGFGIQCPPVLPACCLGYSWTLECRVPTEPECPGGENCACANPVKGVCCDDVTGACTETFADLCGGSFLAGGQCSGEMGACCLPAGGCKTMDKTCCDLLNGQFNSGLPCGDPVACCFPDDTCTVVPATCCPSQADAFPGEDCQPMGACCDTDGACSFTGQVCCEADGRPFFAETTCDESGACCNDDGTCVETIEACCDEQSGRFLGAGSTCGATACCDVDLLIDSNNDGILDDADDAVETTPPGKIIKLNNNDDNDNMVPDLNDPLDPLDPDLALMTAEFEPASATGNWKLTYPGRVKVYDSTGNFLASGQTRSSPPETSFLVEGVAASDAPGDVTITIDFDCDDDMAFDVSDQVVVTVVTLESIEYLPTGSGTTGDLSEDNPDGANGTPAFEGGFRIFPGAADHTTRNTARNIVRIRAVLKPAVADVDVHFRSFDVDDPSANATIDPDGDGRDNRGTLQNVLGGQLNWPGVSHAPDGTGYRGQLREVGQGFAAEGDVLTVATALSGGEGRAEVELAITFNPGDNFRVAASLHQQKLADLDDATGVPTRGDIANFSGVASDQLSVWRHLHLEQDRMTTAQGDFEFGSITSTGVPAAGQVTVVTDIDLPASEANAFENGIVETGGTTYAIVGNTSGTNVRFTIIAAAAPSNGLAIFYQDDWELDTNGMPVTRIDTQDDSNLYDMVRESTVVSENVYADAYMEPAHSTADMFDDLVPAMTHAPDANTNGKTDNEDLFAVVNGHLGIKQFKSDIFWIAYVCTGFEPVGDFDPNTKLVHPWANSINGQPPASVLWLEQIRDVHPNVTEAVLRARATAHEIGHQLDIARAAEEHRAGTVMDADVSVVPAGNFVLHPEDIVWLRSRVQGP